MAKERTVDKHNWREKETEFFLLHVDPVLRSFDKRIRKDKKVPSLQQIMI